MTTNTNPTPTQPETLETGFVCECCQRQMELRIDGKFCNECYHSRAAVTGPRGDAIRDLFDLLEKDSQGQWNFKSLSRDAAKFQDVVERFANAFPHALDPARVFVEAAFHYLNSISNSTVCADRSCIRCRIADVAFEVERTLNTPAASCVKCGHSNFNRVQGECDEPDSENIFCGCKCEFAPAERTEVEGERARRLARKLIDAVINSPCVVETRMFSQPIAVEKLEDEIIALMGFAAAPADNDAKGDR